MKNPHNRPSFLTKLLRHRFFIFFSLVFVFWIGTVFYFPKGEKIEQKNVQLGKLNELPKTNTPIIEENQEEDIPNNFEESGIVMKPNLEAKRYALQSIPKEPDREDSFYKDTNGNRQDVVVLMWDGWTPFTWGQGNYVSVPNYAGWDVEKAGCPVNCVFTVDRNYLHNADALLFDVCLTGPREYRETPIYFPEKRTGQSWIWFAYEQQYYFPMMQEEDYMSRFDYKMTYHYDALVQTTFTCPWGMLNTFLDPPPPKSKDKVVVFMGSNCQTGGADERTEFVKELMKYTNVHSYGGCLHNKDMESRQMKNGRRSHGDKIIEKIGIISEYKFLLAFENNNKVVDYVTEKLTNAYQAGTVPIYWGSPSVERWTIGNQSLINVKDFESPKALAQFINMLNDNDELYYSYFDWKQYGISAQYQRLLDHCIFFAECRLCKRLAEIRNNKTPNSNKLKTHAIDDAFAIQLNRIDTRDTRDDNFVQVNHHPALNLQDKYTITAWINPNLLQDGRIVDKATAGAGDGYSVDILKSEGGPFGKLRLCAAGTCYLGKRKIYVGIWYHIAVVFQNTKGGLRFYINGKLDSTHTPYGPTETNGLPLRFGRAANGGHSWRPYHTTTVYDGLIDDVSIWNIGLSQKTIHDMMYSRLSGKEEGLVAYWGFNEGKGNEARDASPNELHAYFNGDVQWIPSITKPVNDPSDLER